MSLRIAAVSAEMVNLVASLPGRCEAVCLERSWVYESRIYARHAGKRVSWFCGVSMYTWKSRTEAQGS